MSRITLTKPDDWHIHLRDGAMLNRTVNDVAAWANRAVVMPNLTPPVKTLDDATAYRERGFPRGESSTRACVYAARRTAGGEPRLFGCPMDG